MCALLLFFTALVALSRRARISRSLHVSRHRRNLTRSQRQSQRRGMGRRPRRRRSRRRSGSRSSPSRTRPTTRRTHQLRRRKRRRPLRPRPKRQPRPKRRVKRSDKSGACGLFYRAVCGVTTYLELIQLPLAQEKYNISRGILYSFFTRLTRARTSIRNHSRLRTFTFWRRPPEAAHTPRARRACGSPPSPPP